MKYLKRIFELKDETYLKAADRLEKNHPERSKNLRKFVDYRQTYDINYIDNRPLNAMNDIYYITDISTLKDGLNSENINIIIELESANNVVTLHIPNYIPQYDFLGIKYNIINYGTPWGDSVTYSNKNNLNPMIPKQDFYFSDRKSAINFIKILEDNIDDKLLFSINDIYKS